MASSSQFYAGDTFINTFIAVDFGTTYSAFCFATGKESGDYHVQPDAGGSKIPTALLLRPDTTLHSFGQSVIDTYYSLDEDEAEKYYLFDRFKMNLQNDKRVHGDMPIKASNNGKTLPAKLVFSRSLEYFYKMAKEEITRASGFWHDDEVKWILTVPAIWGDRAKEFMRDAANEAGMGSKDIPESFEIALEPEGAALSCRDKLMHVWRECGQPATLRYMVVDCGGGTIDVTVHDLNIASSDVKEVHRATGDAWGGTYVDKHVKALIQRILGDRVSKKLTDDEWLRFTRVSIEKAKRSITDSIDQVFFEIPHEMLAAIAANGGSLENAAKSVPGVKARKGRLMIEVKLVEECFKESLESIAGHVRGLLREVSGIRCILVVGGFAECPFLIKRLEREFHNAECRVVRPRDASTAVVKGAVMYGQCPDVIKVRISKFSYGVRAMIPFDASMHPASRRVETSKGPRCDGIFSEFIELNAAVEIGHPVERSYSTAHKHQATMTFNIYRATSPNIDYVDHPNCEKLVSVSMTFPDPEAHDFRDVMAKMDFSRTLIHFSAVDLTSGEKVQVETKFDGK